MVKIEEVPITPQFYGRSIFYIPPQAKDDVHRKEGVIKGTVGSDVLVQFAGGIPIRIDPKLIKWTIKPI